MAENPDRLDRYLSDALISRMYSAIRSAGAVRSISVDLTHKCNLRCTGCYFFAEGMDQYQAPGDESTFERFLDQEQARGTNFVTVLGGEPSLMLDRLRKIYSRFWTMVVTNGLRRIPRDGFENLPIAVSVWGDHATDTELRGGSRRDVFATALANYRDDDRVVWYYTATPGHASEMASVVSACVDNGNLVGFNFYGDIAGVEGRLDHRQGFAEVRRQLDAAIERYPDRIVCTSYLSRVITTGWLYDEPWGHDVCGSITFDHPANRQRIENGKPYNHHFRAYYPDLESTRRCCVGEQRDCATCFDVWAHMSWILLRRDKHMGSSQEFFNWLSTIYIFYLINRMIDHRDGVRLLPEIHARMAYLRAADILT